MTACEDFFTGIPIELEQEIDAKLAAYCMLNMDDSTIFVQVNRTLPFGQPIDTDDWGQRNVTVELYQNGDLLFGIPNATSQAIYYNSIQFKKELNQPFSNFHQSNATYELVVNSERYGILKATQEVPNLVSIDSVNYRESVRITAPYLEEEDLFEVTFTDPGNEENYYWITVEFENIMSFDSMEFSNIGFLNKPTVYDALLNIENHFVVFEDKNINGQIYTVSIYNNTWKGYESEFFITYKLHSISSDLYLYLKTLDEYNATADNPFAEPSILYHNMEGGLGMFGIFQTASKRVRIR